MQHHPDPQRRHERRPIHRSPGWPRHFVRAAAAAASTCALALVPAAGAATHQLAPGESIQAALDAAANGDVVELAAGTYRGDLDFRGKAVRVRGVGPATILLGSGRGPVVSFVRREGRGAVLDSLTVTGGQAERGGGILVVGASPTIVRTTVRDNRASVSGSGIQLTRSRARLFNNLIVRNLATGDGDPHSVEITDASPLLVNNTIAYGDSNAVLVRGASSFPILLNNLLAYNGSRPPGHGPRGRGICDFGPATVLQHNLFFANRLAAILVGGVDYARAADAEAALQTARLRGNVDGPPRFADAAAGDFRLRPKSRARNAGHPDAAYRNRNGSRNTIGHRGGPYALPAAAVP
jgi:hypothetical protein